MRAPTRHVRHAAAPFFLACVLQACTTWEPRAASASSLADVRASPRHPVRVAVRGGRVLTLTTVVVGDDSLVGLRDDVPRDSVRRVAVPLADVQAVSTRELDPNRTRVLVASVLAAAAALALGVLYLAASLD